MSTIYILWIRQIKKYIRSKSRIVGSLGQPLLFLLALGYGLGSTFQRAGQGNYFSFLAPGIIGMSIIFTAVFSGMEIIWDRQFGFLKETMVAPVSRFAIMIGRTLGGATVATLQGLIVFAIVLLLGFHPVSWGLVPVAIIVMFLVALMFAGLGTAIASLMEDMQAFPLIINFVIMPLFFLSGSLFPLSGLPPALEVITKIDPLSYGIDAFRGLLVNLSQFGLVTDFSVLIVLTLAFLSVGSWLFSRIQI